MRTPTIGSTRAMRTDAPQRAGSYILDQNGLPVIRGTHSRYYVKARTRRPRNRSTGRIKF